MHKFTTSVFINRSQQAVFDFISDPANKPKWQKNVMHGEWTSTSKPGVGSTYKVAVKFLGRNLETLFKITHWDPPNLYGYKSTGLSFPMEILESVYSLTPKENGTLLTYQGQVQIAGIVRFLENSVRKQDEAAESSNLETAKHLLEAG